MSGIRCGHLRRIACAAFLLVAFIPNPSQAARADEKVGDPPQNPFPDAVEVPPGIFEGGTEWLNTSAPIDLKDLRGKIVVIDFWTYCCINCMHVLPDLKYLEEKYPNEVVVIGVHSAKFDNEKVSQSIRDAIMRYEIQHPVVNDSEMLIWRKFGTRAWPTIALIDPEGKYAGSQSGEGHRELLDSVITKMIEYHRWKGTLDEKPLVFKTEASQSKPTELRYPGKVLADAVGQRLFITDSNHNRIVVTSMQGDLQHVIGSGVSGLTDGSFETAQFDHPQGTALVGNELFVADTENHSLRVIDLEAKTVSTLAGTGEQAQFGQLPLGAMRETALNSPWSLAHANGTLYVAMAGSHQIWSHKIDSEAIGVFAGTGREDVIDGTLASSAFAQPSELVTDAAGKFLYVVDSEGSSIRKISLSADGAVTTVAGTSGLPRGQSLFAFGDTDAVGGDARFQHPLGIAISGDSLFVADSYNHKIRQIDLPSGATTTWVGSGKPGDQLDPVMLNEPGGVSIADGRLFVADTNNQRILSLDLATKQATVVTVKGLTAPAAANVAPMPDMKDAVAIETQKVAVGDKLSFDVTLTIPEGNKLNDLAPISWEVFADGDQSIVSKDLLGVRNEATANDQKVAHFELPLTGQPGEATLFVRMNYGYCGTEKNALCRLASAKWKVPVTLSADGGAKGVELSFPKP